MITSQEHPSGALKTVSGKRWSVSLAPAYAECFERGELRGLLDFSGDPHRLIKNEIGVQLPQNFLCKICVVIVALCIQGRLVIVAAKELMNC